MLGLFFGEESGEGDDVGIDFLCSYGGSLPVCLSHGYWSILVNRERLVKFKKVSEMF